MLDSKSAMEHLKGNEKPFSYFPYEAISAIAYSACIQKLPEQKYGQKFYYSHWGLPRIVAGSFSRSRSISTEYTSPSQWTPPVGWNSTLRQHHWSPWKSWMCQCQEPHAQKSFRWHCWSSQLHALHPKTPWRGFQQRHQGQGKDHTWEINLHLTGSNEHCSMFM